MLSADVDSSVGATDVGAVLPIADTWRAVTAVVVAVVIIVVVRGGGSDGSLGVKDIRTSPTCNRWTLRP